MMHGKYPKRLKDADVDQRKTNQWLRSTGLKGETYRRPDDYSPRCQFSHPFLSKMQLTLTAGFAKNLKTPLITLSQAARN